jgi:hypothetical protein
MRLTKALYLPIAWAIASLPCAASTVGYLDFTGGGVGPGGIISPYTGNLSLGGAYNPSTATALQLFCDDFSDHVSIGDIYQVNISTISNLSSTRFGGVQGATQLYEQVFYLADQLLFAGDLTTQTNIQDAIWQIFDPTDFPNTASNAAAVTQWRNTALNNYKSVGSYASWNILTDANIQGAGLGGKQELLYTTSPVPHYSVGTPEPGTVAMTFGGVALLAYGRRRKLRT